MLAAGVLRVVVDEDPETEPRRAVRAGFLAIDEVALVLDLDAVEAAEITAALADGVPYMDNAHGDRERLYLIPGVGD